jgi:poly(3-hydroxybutyrate) depolymerase
VSGGASWNSDYPTTVPDDVSYVRELVDELVAGADVDPSRVFVTGFSAGGWMSHRLGYELSDRLAAISTISSSLYIRNAGGSTALPDAAGPVSVIALAGNADPEVFYCGETSQIVTVGSQDETFDYWSGPHGNGCANVTPSGPLCSTTHGTHAPGGALTSVDQKVATGCAGGAEVQFYELAGGDHRYYGSTDLTVAPGDSTAPYNSHFNAGTGTTGVEVLWKFFAAHPKSSGSGGASASSGAGMNGAGGGSVTGAGGGTSTSTSTSTSGEGAGGARGGPSGATGGGESMDGPNPGGGRGLSSGCSASGGTARFGEVLVILGLASLLRRRARRGDESVQ